MQNKHYFFFPFWESQRKGGSHAGWAKFPTFTENLFCTKTQSTGFVLQCCCWGAGESLCLQAPHRGLKGLQLPFNVLKWVSSISAIACLALTCTVAAPPRIQRILDLAQFSAQVMNFRERSITESGAKNVTFY